MLEQTFGCMRWLSVINSAMPFPALATPFTSEVDTPSPTPRQNTLQVTYKSTPSFHILFFTKGD